MNYILNLIHIYSSLYGVDPRLIQAIVEVESHYDPTVIGEHGEVGLMQVTPSIAHKSVRELQNPETNIIEGIKLLNKIKGECVHKKDFTYVVCYNLGSPRGNKVKYPKQYLYYKNIIQEYENVKNSSIQAR